MNEEPRLSLPGDEPELKFIWKTVFGDSDAAIDAFFRYLYAPGRAVVYEEDGKIVCAAYAIPLGRFVYGIRSVPCSALYAFGTLPEYRSRGIGSKVAKMAAEVTSLVGVSVLCPAEDSLFDYYEKSIGYTDGFYACEMAGADPGMALNGSASRLSAASYAVLREELLADIDHIAFSSETLSYQEHLCLHSGGGLFSVNVGKYRGAAAVEVYNNMAYIKELLLPGGPLYDAASITSRALGIKEFKFRSPVRPGREGRHFGMILNAPEGTRSDLGFSWYGFAFD